MDDRENIKVITCNADTAAAAATDSRNAAFMMMNLARSAM